MGGDTLSLLPSVTRKALTEAWGGGGGGAEVKEGKCRSKGQVVFDF